MTIVGSESGRESWDETELFNTLALVYCFYMPFGFLEIV